MSLDATTSRLTMTGTVTVQPDKEGRTHIYIEGFRGHGCSCRDVAVLACLWAIGELQREVMRCVETPGGGKIGVG